MTVVVPSTGSAKAAIREARVLVVDDIQSNRRLLEQHLKRQGIVKISEAADGVEAMEVLRSRSVDLVLLDVMMPRLDGYQVLEQMQADERLRHVPVIMITALDDMDSAVRCISSGAEDYVLKPFNPFLLRARVAAILEKKRLREMEREYLRFYDATTGLANRDALLARLEQELLRRHHPRQRFSLLVVNFKRYRTIADSLGEGAWDEYLTAQAERIKPLLPPTAFVSRSGQNSFAVLAVAVERGTEASLLGRRIHETLEKPLNLRGHSVAGGVGVGITLSGGNDATALSLLRDATLAAQRATPAEGCRIFDEAMHTEAMIRLELEPALRHAVENEQLVLFYQPIVALSDGKVASLEALVRWQHPERGMLYPDHFIPLAEETGLIVPIGRWVTENACRQLERWQRQKGADTLSVGINVSARELIESEFVASLSRSLAAIEDRKDTFKIELTETLLIDNPATVERIIQEVNALGVQTVLDDFGTGYCSLSYLHRFAFNTLKIDRSFTGSIDSMPRNRKIVASTIQLAHDLGMNVVAEGIETRAEADILRDMACEFGQGAYFSLPLPAEAVESLF